MSEFNDVSSNIDGPEDIDGAKVVVGVVPITSVDAPQEDVMGDFGVVIFETVGFSGWSDTAASEISDDEPLRLTTSDETDSEVLSFCCLDHQAEWLLEPSFLHTIQEDQKECGRQMVEKDH